MNSKPTKTNQEPGVNGVTRASRPMMIKRMPIVFLIAILYIAILTKIPLLIFRLGTKFVQAFIDPFQQSFNLSKCCCLG